MSSTKVITNGHSAMSSTDIITNGHSAMSSTGVITNGHIAKDDKNSLHITDRRTGLAYDIPIKRNAIQATDFKKIKAVDEKSLASDCVEGGLRVLDPGFNNTAVKESAITFVDGRKGEIYYRGHSILDLSGKKGYEEVIYLLIWGRLPSAQEKIIFSLSLATYPSPPPAVFETVKAFPRDAPPMLMTIAATAALDAAYPEWIPAFAGTNLYLGNMALVDHQIIRSCCAANTLASIVYCHQRGREWTHPEPGLSYVENTLLMMGHVDERTKRPKPKHVQYLERLWVLMADHEMTHSTAAFLHTASSLSDVLISMISGTAAAWGILHGGAIEMAYKQFERVGDISGVQKLIDNVKAGKLRLYGYGHRIYKVTDPRYYCIKAMLDELIADGLADDPILRTALEIDRIASTDEYFTSRGLKPNADLLASFVYKALELPADSILPLSCLSRTPGSIAHWREAMCTKPSIWRPQQIYTGQLGISSNGSADGFEIKGGKAVTA